jgi:hypothetical protein
VAGIFGDEQTFLQGRLAPQPVQGHFEYGAIGFADADMSGQGHAFVHGFKAFAQGGGVGILEVSDEAQRSVITLSADTLFVAGTMLLTFNLQFKLNEAGVRAKVAPLIGMEYGF